MSDQKYDCLKLENQLCFPLYVAARKVTSKYRLFLKEIDLTYTQYITMMVLWNEGEMNVKELGERLFLDSGTLTPVLKSLEHKGYITRTRSLSDERVLNVALTEEGVALKERATSVPPRMKKCITLSEEEGEQLRRLICRVIGCL